MVRPVTSHRMDPILIDPNNHAPEITPDDAWGDAAWHHGASARMLPAKKSRQDASLPVSVTKHSVGLRLGTDAPIRSTEEAGSPLEVHEINGAVVRLVTEVPTVTKVARQFTFHAKPVETGEARPHLGEGKAWGHSRKQSLRWLLVSSAGVVTLVALGLLLLPWINQANAVRRLPGQDALILESDEPLEDLESLNEMLTRQPAAEQLFRAFATATTVSDILPLVRDAKTVLPLIRRHPLPAPLSKAWLPPSDTRWSVFTSHGKPCALLEGSLPNFSTFSASMVLIDNQLLLDWKATTGYGTATFDALKKNLGDPDEIRGKIQKAGFFTAIFPEATYQSYQFVSPTDDQSIWCYARRGEAAQAALDKLFGDGEILTATGEAQKVTLRLEHSPPGALSNQWLVKEMLHQDWITP